MILSQNRMDLESEDTWSDSESEAGDHDGLPLHSRAYQIEMFEQSMQGNIIAIVGRGLIRRLTLLTYMQMSTGSGKTLV